LSEYRLFETAPFLRDLDSLDASTSKRIRNTLTKRVYPVLKVSPRQAPSASRLQAWDPPTWRVRIGSWRIFYEIDDERRTVSITAIDHRREAYR
jgi:mRNA interferase RelE/StbE